jgi:hypothetical protein
MDKSMTECSSRTSEHQHVINSEFRGLMKDLFALADKDGDGGVDLDDLFQHLDFDGNG